MMFKGKLGQGLGGMASLAGGVKNKAQQGWEGAKTHAKETATTHPVGARPPTCEGRPPSCARSRRGA